MKTAALSFGGPTGQISVMHQILVEEKRWISENRFLHALNYCMLLPGPEAQQLAIYIGWLLHGTRGGLVAGTLFVGVQCTRWCDLLPCHSNLSEDKSGRKPEHRRRGTRDRLTRIARSSLTLNYLSEKLQAEAKMPAFIIVTEGDE